MGEKLDDDWQLEHLQRLLTLGQLTADMMHELRQPLAAIRNFSEAALAKVRAGIGDETGEIENALATIFVQAGRAQQMTRTANTFSRESEPAQFCQVTELIEELLPLLEMEFAQRDVEFDSVIEADLPPLHVHRVEIEQVIVNLLRNAIDAVAACSAPRRKVSLSASLTGRGSLRIAVSDQGTGIDEANLEKIFDRFFTTKNTGVGLGLEVSRRIAESHGGTLQVTRNPEHGVTFELDLPVAPP